MSIGRICSREMVLADAGESVRAAAERMRAKNVGTLIITDPDQHPVGILTDRDLATRVVAPGKVAEETLVEEVMTHDPDTIIDDAPIEAALQRMASARARRLVVVGSAGTLVGVVSIDDILELLSEEMLTIGNLLAQQRPH